MVAATIGVIKISQSGVLTYTTKEWLKNPRVLMYSYF